MKTAALTTLILLCVLALPEFAAAEDAFPLQEAAKAAGLSPDAAGIFVQDPASGRVVYAVGADRELNPASTMKLLTTYAALDMLGPAFTWKTEVWADGTLQGDVLKGNLVIKGSGDPKLTLENLWLMLRGVRNRGLKHVRGDLVLDRSAFQDVDIDPARFDGDPTRAYNVGPDALLVNYKAVRVHLLPDPGSRAVRVILDPPLANVQVENRMTVGGGPCGDWRALIAPHLEDDGKKARLSFRGAVPASCGERSFYLSVLGHAPYTGGVFRYLWEELGGTLSGSCATAASVRRASCCSPGNPPRWRKWYVTSTSSATTSWRASSFSRWGRRRWDPPLLPKNPPVRSANGWTRRGCPSRELVLENGSGLSRVERISARHLGEVLTAAYRSPVMPELMASLPVAAVDGTMRKRLRGGGVAGQAHLKTGSLDGVKSVAGYVLDAQGRRMVVVCIVNHVGTNIAAGVLQDALLSWVYQRP